MTRKDFVLIAQAVHEIVLDRPTSPTAALEYVAISLADALETTNPAFDRKRFLEAALEGKGLPR